MITINRVVKAVTHAIRQRSQSSRERYLELIRRAGEGGPQRTTMSCTNLAHAMAASPAQDKRRLASSKPCNVAIVSAYNDMLSAHQPLQPFPDLIKRSIRDAGGIAQFAGGVPAMCDGVTQGQPGMELSLFSRDVIAMATAIALSHQVFDAALYLGVCDKIIPGMLMGALRFGHLPALMVPAGPMTSGLSNFQKAAARERFWAGEIDRDALLEVESAAYHGPGTCTFYGTANSNQMLMEVMGLHLPGTAFVNPNTALREALTKAAGLQVMSLAQAGSDYTPVGEMVGARALVNAIVGLLATGGSTNHTMHLIAIAAAAGLKVTWDDFDALSEVVPLLCRIYPNGSADVNHFHAAGGMGFLIRQLLKGGLMHADVRTVIPGRGLEAFTEEPYLIDGELAWRPAPETSGDLDVLRPLNDPFDPTGGLKLLRGNLGRSVIKVSAVSDEHQVVRAPARVFISQTDFLAASRSLQEDFVAVLPFQGPKANGMPELHKLTPALAALQKQGHAVALVTDGRMSGASGKVPAAIHVCPEAAVGGLLAKVQDGDMVRLNAKTGELFVEVDETVLQARMPLAMPEPELGVGRELFAGLRGQAADAEQGALTMDLAL